GREEPLTDPTPSAGSSRPEAAGNQRPLHGSMNALPPNWPTDQVPDSLIHAVPIEKRDHSLEMVWRPIRLWLCET
ncbi:MAG: hypothetical protein JWO52_3063, partial [Gammaproteobacteria bacterium]|nr:hypothetical protein [Gammaproteobacteria bacterium]